MGPHRLYHHLTYGLHQAGVPTGLMPDEHFILWAQRGASPSSELTEQPACLL